MFHTDKTFRHLTGTSKKLSWFNSVVVQNSYFCNKNEYYNNLICSHTFEGVSSPFSLLSFFPPKRPQIWSFLWVLWIFEQPGRVKFLLFTKFVLISSLSAWGKRILVDMKEPIQTIATCSRKQMMVFLHRN